MEGQTCLLSGGASDSPVHHRTVAVDGPVRFSFLFWRRRPLQILGSWRTGHCPMPPADRWRGPRVARGLHGRPLRWRSLAHRTVWCTTGQSGELKPYAADEFPRVASSPELALRTGHCPVHHRTVRCTQTEQHLAVHSQLSFIEISPVSST